MAAVLIGPGGVITRIPTSSQVIRPDERWNTIAQQPDVLQVLTGPDKAWGHEWLFALSRQAPPLDLRGYQAGEFRLQLASDPEADPIVLTLADGYVSFIQSDPDSDVLDVLQVFVEDTGALAIPVGLYETLLSVGEVAGVADEPLIRGLASVIEEP